jgi:pilus assembly protein CpaC
MSHRLLQCACLLAVLTAPGAWGQSPPASTTVPHVITLVTGRGELLQFAGDVQRAAVSEPKVADFNVVSPHEVMVNAKGVGKTTLIVWENGAAPVRYDINVVPDTTDIEGFRQAIREQFPNVTVTGSGDTMVLSGSVADAEQSKRAAAYVSTRAKNVVNLLQLPPAAEPRQILLQVKFATVDRVALSEVGFNYFSRNPKALGAISTEQFQTPRFSQLQFQNQDFANTTINFADVLNLFVFRPDLNIGATIRALASRNLLQILAEPNLICVEGKEASFLAGGEFPFPTLTSTSTGGAVAPVVTVQFKKFGVELNFTPTMLPNGSIYLKVAPSVSSLDFENAVTLQGFLIPALATRSAETEVVLRDGESFAIAGLMDNRVVQTLSRIPGLGNVPIIGNLFRSRSTRKSADELLVVITPHFVKPLSPDEKAKMPDTVVPYLPSVSEEKARGRHKKDKKDPQKPAFVGASGHQEPATPPPGKDSK